MNAKMIQFSTPSGEYEIPNRWELLTPEQYLYVCSLLARYASGSISYRRLHLEYVCKMLDLDIRRIHGITAYENLYLLSSSVDFIFKDLEHINNCFLAQLLPELVVGNRCFNAYKVQTFCGVLTCTLTAMQFIEAYELTGCQAEQLPLLAAILYYPGKYSSEGAHALSERFVTVDLLELQAIALNFQSLVNYLFTQPPFNILYTHKPKEHKPTISVGMAEGLYNLSVDGLGNVEVIEQMPVIKYLTILRKKLIESVTAMNDAGIDMVEISDKTGLSIKLIKQII